MDRIDYDDLVIICKAKDKEIERLRKALQEYGNHYLRCHKLERESNDCSCGFEQALK